MALGNSISYSAVGIICNSGDVQVDGSVIVNQSIITNEPGLPFHEFPLPKPITTFRGRQKEIADLYDLFFEQNIKKIVICGLPGYGKTELSKQFAQHCLESENRKVTRVLWIKADSKDRLEESYPNLHQIYERCSENCLVIFDNGVCRRDTADFEPPEKDNFFLLVTSQEKDWGDDVTSVPLDKLSQEFAIEVLKSILGNYYNEEDRNLYEQLANTTDNVPKELQSIGGYVHQHMKILKSKFDLQKYLEKIKKTPEDVMKETIPRSSPNSYEKPIYAAMEACKQN